MLNTRASSYSSGDGPSDVGLCRNARTVKDAKIMDLDQRPLSGLGLDGPITAWWVEQSPLGGCGRIC